MSIVNPRTFKNRLILGSIAILAGCKSSENNYVPPPPPEVTVSHPVKESVTPFLEKNGVIEAVDQAEVRARVRGFVQLVKFEPGQEVKKGDILYQIESDQYEAVVNSATAAVAASEAAIAVANGLVKTAEAELKRTGQNLDRQRRLVEQNAGAQAEVDNAVAANDSATAALESAKANVEAAIADKGRNVASLAQAQLDLDYTLVRSPIDGRISPTDVKVGNLVENGGQLAVVANRQNVFTNFSISDREMLQFMKASKAELKPGEQDTELDWSEIPVYLGRESDEGFPFVGELNYVDQEGIDTDTGTLGLRAQHENNDNRLFPGLFVTVRMPIASPVEAMLIPEYAVLRDQRGKYVLVVNRDSKVERAEISTPKTISGWAVIESGLTSESRVVIDGLQRARPGLEVTAIDAPLEIDDETLLRGFSPRTAVSNEAAAVSVSGTSEDE